MNCALLEAINQTCEASVTYGLPEQEIVSTGLPQLDTALGGGIPRGRIVEIHGSDGSGKTALALRLAQQLPGPTLYVDADHACFSAVSSGAVGAVVIDTVAALPTNEDMWNSINDRYWGQRERQAKVMSKALPILAPFLHHTGCTLILVNQLREKPSVMYGNPERPTGGKAIGFYAALRLDTRRYEVIKESAHITGQLMRVSVTKNKLAPPGREAKVRLVYGKGLSA